MSAVQVCNDVLRRFRYDGSAEQPGGLAETVYDPGYVYPAGNVVWWRPFALKRLSDVAKAEDKQAFQHRTPPVGYVRALTSPANQGPTMEAAHRRSRGRVAANGLVDPDVIRNGPPKGLLTTDFRFVP